MIESLGYTVQNQVLMERLIRTTTARITYVVDGLRVVLRDGPVPNENEEEGARKLGQEDPKGHGAFERAQHGGEAH